MRKSWLCAFLFLSALAAGMTFPAFGQAPAQFGRAPAQFGQAPAPMVWDVPGPERGLSRFDVEDLMRAQGEAALRRLEEIQRTVDPNLMVKVQLPGSNLTSGILVHDIVKLVSDLIYQVLHLIEEYAQTYYQVQQWYQELKRWVDLAERVWRDPLYVVGETIWESMEQMQLPDSATGLKGLAYGLDSLLDRFEELYPGWDPPAFAEEGDFYSWEGYPDLARQRAKSFRHLMAKSSDTLRLVMGESARGVKQYKILKDLAPSVSGDEQWNEFHAALLMSIADELMLTRPAVMNLANTSSVAETDRMVRESEVSGKAWKLVEGSLLFDIGAANPGEWRP